MYNQKQIPIQKTTKVTSYLPPLHDNDNNFSKTKKLFYQLTKSNTESLIICPEIFISAANTYSAIQKKNSFYIDKYLAEKPNTIFVYGQELKSKSNLYNTILVKTQKETIFRVKQKLVPIREYTPSIIEKIFNVKSYYKKNNRDFTLQIKEKYKFTPIVCYESIFSIFTANISTNCDFLILGSSEEFMNNSYYGKQQYLNIVRLRAIETRKQILKCSNQGISCILNSKGNIVKLLNTGLDNSEIIIHKKNSFYQSLLGYLPKL